MRDAPAITFISFVCVSTTMPHPPSLRRRPRRWDPLPSFRIAVQSTSLSVFECALTSVLSQFWRNVWKPIEESFESLLSASETKVRPSSVGTAKVGKLETRPCRLLQFLNTVVYRIGEQVVEGHTCSRCSILWETVTVAFDRSSRVNSTNFQRNWAISKGRRRRVTRSWDSAVT